MSQWESTPDEQEHTPKEEFDEEQGIAIIGMAGRFPGAATLDVFWSNLRDGVESIRFFSDQQLEVLGVDPRALRDPHFVKAGAIIDGVELFDAGFFGYSPREAELIDPQQRIFLECAWEALEHAGYDPRRFPGLIGVYAGMGMSTYLLFNLLSNTDILDEGDSPLVMLGNDKDFLSTRVSYNLNLKGPSLDVQTGCSTSLVAAHIACEHLLSYQCDLALAGGVAVSVPQRTGYLYEDGGIASPDGHCRAFDAEAQGSIFGSGVGAVILKRLADALADGDTIYAVIKGSAINNDGALKVGFTAPSVEGQAEVIARAQAIAGVEPGAISYIEAHGTGTALGDPMEVAALTRVFRAATDRASFCALGSVKTNIGHLDTAAGVAGLIKTVLALKHRQIPPSLHFRAPNPQIDFATSPFYVNAALAEWPGGSMPRRAGVSSFGFGGTNAHFILEEAPPASESGESRPWQLLLLSARSEAALEQATDRLAEHLRSHPEQPLADIAYTLQIGRAVFEQRRILVCRDREDAVQALESRDPRRLLTRSERTDERPVVFMFAGMGDQYAGMSQELYQVEPVFREAIDRCAALLEPLLGLDLRDLLYPDRGRGPQDGAQALDLRAMLAATRGQGGETAQKLNQPAFAQPAVFVVEYALGRLLMSWGIRPQALIGHSLGEYVAACLAGVFSLEDALTLVARRARMIQELPGGAMLAVPLPESEVQPLLRPQLFLSAVNGPAVCVVAGPPDAVAALEQQLAGRGLACRRLLASHAMHSAMMEPIMRPLGDLASTIRLSPPRIPFVSNVTGTWMTDADATDPGYWVRHLRQTVRFAEGLRVVWDDRERALLEIGPGQALSTLALEEAGDEGRVVLQTLRPSYDRRQTDAAFLQSTLGRLWLAGAPVDWEGFYIHERRRRVPLPTYPFERQRYWIEPRPPGERAAPRQAQPTKKPVIADWFYAPSWRRAPALKPFAAGELAKQPRRWLVFADANGLAAPIVERLEQAGQAVVVVEAGPRYGRSRADAYTLDPRSREGYDELFAELQAQGHLPDAIIHLWSTMPADHPAAGTANFETAQDRGFYSLLFIAQALAGLEFAAPLELWVITSRLHAIDGADIAAPEQATLLGPCKVIPQEYDNILCRCIDIAAGPGVIDQVMAEIGAQSPDRVVACRGPWRWVQSFEPLPLDGEAAPLRPLRERGVYLITGGLGGIGLLLADKLAETLDARLILTGRSVFPERAAWDGWLAAHGDDDRVSRTIRRLLALEQRGAEVLVASADAADAAQMRAVVERAEARFGPLNGLIHAAGIAGEQAFQLIPAADRDVCAGQFHPKAYGAYALAELLHGRALDFCLLFSSNTAILGGLGSVAYTAANAFLDAFAQEQSRAGATPWISANWDGWLLSDAPASAFQTSIDQYAMAPVESVECFRRVVTSATETQVVVSTGDLAQRLSIWINRAAADGAQDGVAPAARHPRPALPSSYVAPENEIEQTVAQVWQDLLGIEQIGIHDNFFDLGGHSLLGLKVIARLRGELGVDIPVVSLFEGPTVRALTNVIVQKQGDAPAYEASQRQGAARKQKIREQRQRKQYAAQESEHG